MQALISLHTNPLTRHIFLAMSDIAGDFSSNAHTTPVIEAQGRFDASYEVPGRHPELSFEDGNLAVLCGHQYFLVHRSVLFRHSAVLEEMARSSFSDKELQILEYINRLQGLAYQRYQAEDPADEERWTSFNNLLQHVLLNCL